MPVYVLFRCLCVFQLFFVCLGVGFSVSFRVCWVSVSLHVLSGVSFSLMFIRSPFVCLSCPCVFISCPLVCLSCPCVYQLSACMFKLSVCLSAVRLYV